jgi:hypothetical protein
MISASADVLSALKEGLAVIAKPRAVIEWNHNRYTDTTVDNYGHPEASYGFDLDLYPASSVTEPLRPTRGILMGRVNEGMVTSGYSDVPGSYRAYAASVDSKYKYWSSPDPSSLVNISGSYSITNAQPYVLYASLVSTNKIYLCFENSWAGPAQYTIQITTDGSTWTNAGSNIALNSKGVATLYRQANGTWGTTVYRDNPLDIRGIRVNVTNLTRGGSYLNVIEMSARLEVDVTPYLIEYEVDNELSAEDFVSPIGNASSNTGTITLSNVDGRFNNDNSGGPYKGLIDANAQITIDLGIDTTSYGGAGVTYITQCTMFSGEWAGNEQVEVELKDASKFLQEIKPLRLLMQGVTIGQAVWRLLDSIGFNSYSYSKTADDDSTTIDYFWTDSDRTVWDTIQDICRTTQSAVFFDQFGVLQIQTRQAAFDLTKSPAWTLDYNKNGTKQPDIINLDVGSQYEANKVTIKYRPTALATDDSGNPISEIVWQPDDTVVLRCAYLQAAMNATQMYFYITQDQALIWPYDGIANIGGELVKYKGKEYNYLDSNGSWQSKIIYSNDDKTAIDNTNTNFSWRNFFTGKMIAIERGYDFTTAEQHDIGITQWQAMGGFYGGVGGAQTYWPGGMQFNPVESALRITSSPWFNNEMLYCCPRGNTIDVPPSNVGTRIKFPSSPRGASQSGGMFFFANDAMNSMLCVHITSTQHLAVEGRRSFANELRIMRRTGGTWTSLVGNGVPFNIEQDKWYDLAVTISGNVLSVMLNGSLVLQASDSVIARTNRIGLYALGYSIIDFQYFWAADQNFSPVMDLDNSSFVDLINGGYVSNQTYQDVAYMTKTATSRRGDKTITYKQKYAQRFLDEFGKTVHEVRPYKVDFEKFPVMYSSLYISNTYQSIVDEYVHNPFGAEFIVANASRKDAVLNGEDTITFGADNSVDQKMVITGRTVQQKEERSYEVQDDDAVRARGEIALEIASDWIQTEAAAKALGDWIVAHWAEPADVVQVDIFGNPLLQIGDIVAVNYPIRSMTEATHKYFVLEIKHTWDNGLTTSLKLRRARV